MRLRKPPGPKPAGRTERLTICLEPEQKEALESRAAAEGVPVSVLIRQAIKKLLRG